MPLLKKLKTLPWRHGGHCWIALKSYPALNGQMTETLMREGFAARGDYWIGAFPSPWTEAWARINAWPGNTHGTEAAVIEAEEEPDAYALSTVWKPFSAMTGVAESLWLVEALEADRVLCYLQPVMSAAGKAVGYESFVRVRKQDGAIIGGHEVVHAARQLGIEYAIDRHLHVEAVKTFAAAGINGYLFVNFFPGFIQRPEVYLEGLDETARAYGLPSKHVTLDFTHAESPHDAEHLKKVTGYCRAQGYSIALDDVATYSGAQRLIGDIRPDFVKLDRTLALCAAPDDIRHLKQIVSFAHAAGALVIAEGVENEAAFHCFKEASVDLFQGYHFAPPLPVEEALLVEKRSA